MNASYCKSLNSPLLETNGWSAREWKIHKNCQTRNIVLKMGKGWSQTITYGFECLSLTLAWLFKNSNSEGKFQRLSQKCCWVSSRKRDHVGRHKDHEERDHVGRHKTRRMPIEEIVWKITFVTKIVTFLLSQCAGD